MAAGNTYVALATNTLSSDTATVTFSSISGSYTDLVLVITPASSAQKDVDIRLNGDTGTNYSSTVLGGNGTTVTSARETTVSTARITYYGATNTTLGNSVFIVNLMNYSNTTTYKTILSRTNNASTGVDASVGLWRNTAAITSITLGPNITQGTATWSAGSTFTLYGILAA
jgi:hypothetical protein